MTSAAVQVMNQELDRLPLYYIWMHLNADFRAVLVRNAMRPTDKIDFQQAAIAEYVDLPNHIQNGVMRQFKELAKLKHKDLSRPNRTNTFWMSEL